MYKLAVEFGGNLKAARGEKTMRVMAEICGVSDRHYSDLEKGKALPNLYTAKQIQKNTGISLDALEFVEEKK